MPSSVPSLIKPTWPAPLSVRAYVSTRLGGKSKSPFDSLNLGLHVQDNPQTVKENRQMFASSVGMPNTAVWLNQVHGTEVLCLPNTGESIEADGAFTETEKQVCAILTADCLPVFFCNQAGTQVAVAHAGWRGLCEGVLEATLAHFDKAEEVMVWLGPAIGPGAFEVGGEVRSAFIKEQPEAIDAFTAVPDKENKWLGDLYLLARQRLQAMKVFGVYGGDHCTFTEESAFYSYRRDGKTGRMASVIWIER